MDPTDQVSDPSSPAPASDAIGLTERLSGTVATLHAELASFSDAAARLEKRSSELDERERALAAQSNRMNEVEQALAERARELQEGQDRLARQAGECRAREEHLASRESALTEREHALASRESAAAAHERADAPHDHRAREMEAQVARLAEAADALAIRRDRLKRQRILLTQRAEVLLRAKQTLAQRLADTQRLAAVSPAGRHAVQPARGHAAMLRAAGVAGMGMAAILGVSWWVAGVLDRPVHLAETTLAMEVAPETVEGAGESWRRFHEDLARDPHLMQVAAERLKRRGRDDLASPTDLRAYLADHLAMDVPGAGRIRLTLTGRGRERTLRVLETFTSAVVSIANDSRDRRLDKSNTLVASPPTASADPVRSARLPIFAATATVLAVGSLAGAASYVRISARRGGAAPTAGGATDASPRRWSIPVK